MKFVVTACCFLLLSFSAQAQLTLTWTGGGTSDNWSDPNNWDGVNTPDATHNLLVFDGSTRLTPNNDLSGLTIQQIQFGSSAGSFTLSGNSFTLGSGTAPINTIINNISLTTETINNSFTLGSDQTWYGNAAFFANTYYNGNINNNGFTITTSASGTALHHINGSISGTGGFNSQANGSTTLSGNNTYTGLTSGVFSFFNLYGSVTSNVDSGPGCYFTDNGTINGNLSVNGIGNDALQIDFGLATINGNASINGTSHEEWSLGVLQDDFTGGTPGTNWGEILVNGGDLTYSSTSFFNIHFGGGATNPDGGDPFWNNTRRWLVGSVNSGSLNYSGIDLGNGTWTSGYFFLEQQGNNLYLNWQVAPEPSSLAIIGFGAFILAVIKRRSIFA